MNPGSGTFSNVTNGVQYTGAKTATLTVISPAYGFNGYQFRCLVSGNCSPPTVTSNPAILTVNQFANISIQPSNANSCQGSNVSFSVTASGTGLTYQWYEKAGAGAFLPITDGGIYSGSLTSILTLTGVSTAMNNNQYMVVISEGTCVVNSSIASLSVNAQPTLTITNPASVCAPGTVDITAAAVTAGSNLAGGTLSYWQDAATTVVLNNPNSVSVSATYYIRVGTSPVCYAVSPVVVNVIAAITNNTITAAQNLCSGSAAATLTGGIPSGGTGSYTYQWQSSPDNSSWSSITGATSPSYSPGILASSTYYQRIVNSGVCSNTSPSILIAINPLPVATFSYTGSPYCQNAANPSPTFSGGGVAGTFSSTVGLVFVSTATGQINLSASTPGIYTVTNTIAAAGGCAAVTATSSVTITALPVATFSYAGSPYCQTAANPSPTFSGGGVAGTFSSTAGLVFVSTATGQINLSASTPGTYTVTNTIAASGGCTAVTATSSITITALPVATFSYTGTPYCSNAANPSPTFSGGGVAGTFSSTAGLVFVSTATGQINLSASTPGTYTVTNTIAASGGCGAVTATSSITITALPVATFSYTGTPYCQNAANPSPTFSGGGVAGTFSSTAGLVFVSTATGQINLSASTPGTYTVTNTIAASGGCGAVTATSSITITALPIATFSYAGTPYCSNAANPSPTFSGGGVAGTFSSTAGLVFVSTATGQINLSASTPGTYTVTNTIAASGGCAAVTATSSITITALPVATFSYTGTPYCQNAANPSPTFSGGGVAGTFSSTAGLVFVSTATGQINLSASTPGTYTVTNTIAAAGGCGAVTATSSITITTLPAATISYAGTPFCKTLVGAQAVTQTGTAGGTYSSTAGLTINAATGAITPSSSTAGTYTVTYTMAAAAGCAAQTATTSVTITALPVATFSYTGTPYCQNAANPSPTFSGGGVAGTFSSTVGLVFVSTATGQINLSASTPGTYTVTNTIAAANGCAAVTATSSVTITALPVATFSYTGTPYCQNAANPSPTFSGGGVAGTFSSTAGLVFVSTATGQINLSASTPGTYTVTNTIAAAGGCGAVTATSSITITTLPAATISYAGTPFCKTLVGAQAVTQTGTAGGAYSSTAGLTINAVTGAITPSSSTAGTYTVTYTMAAAGGCAAQTATTSVTITTLPVATFSYTGTPYCQNAANPSPTFSGGGVAGTFSSTGGLVFVSTTTGQINLSASTPGTYTVTNTIAAAGGCAAVTATSSVTITALPVATFSYAGSPYCQNAANPNPTFSGGGVAGTFSSTTGLVFVSTVTGQINLSASTPGTYTVTNTIAASGGCAAVTATSSITITTLPAATISYGGTPFCKTLVGAQSVTQTGTAGGTYSSTAGLTIDAVTGAITPSTSTAGTYTVTYTMAAAGGCAAQTATTSVTITALPVATFSYTGSPYCSNAANPGPTFSGGGVAGTFSSTVGLVFVSTTTGQINLAGSTPGTYTVTNTIAAAAGCAAVTATSSVTITALPVATFSYTGSPYCQNAANPGPTFSGGGVAGTFSSTAGLVFVSTATGQINLAASTPGTYTVTNTIAASGGCAVVTATSSITITALPAATINYAGSPFCSSLVGAQSVTQTGTAGGTYSSTAGLTIDAVTGAITPSSSTAGTYTVTYTMAAAGGCAAQTATTSVTITTLPAATINYAGSPFCSSLVGAQSVTQTGTAGGTYSSTAGLTIDAVTGAITPSSSTAGTYTVTYTIAAAGGCAAQTATTSVTITALPVATFSYTGTPYCQNAANPTPTFSGGGVAGTFSSTAGLVFISTATGQINLSASTPGTYTVTNTIAASGGCAVVTATSSITITALPTATISYTGSPFCSSLVGAQSVTQTGTVGGTYSSTAGLTIDAVTGAIKPSSSTAGTYTVTYTMAAAGGCAAQTATTSVTITTLPGATISYAGSPFCSSLVGAQSVTQTGTAGGAYSSTAGLTIDAVTGAIMPSSSTAGTYTVTYTIAAAGGCAAQTATTSVIITALPTATISYAGSPFCSSLVGAQSVTQTGTAGGTYSSTAGLTIDAVTGAITPSSSTAGTYTVTYTMAAAGGCAVQTATTSVTITTLPTATINYAGSPFCSSLVGGQSVTQTGSGGGRNLFSSTAGLTIDAVTGQITPSSKHCGNLYGYLYNGGSRRMCCTDSNDFCYYHCFTGSNIQLYRNTLLPECSELDSDV